MQLGFEALGTPLIATTFVVLDLETTGLSPATDRITEIGAVKVCGGEVLGELRTFVHPGRPIPPAITAVTGITDAMVRDAPPIAVVLPVVVDFLGDAVLVAHNAGFDVGFLRAAAAAAGVPAPAPVVVDTARLARRVLKDEVRNYRLATLAAHLRAPTRPDHRALTDARATVAVLHGLLERAGTLGATSLEDLRDLTRASSDASFRRRGLVADAPASCGVYRFVDERGEVLYVGKATDLRARLRSYFGQDPRRRIADLVRETARVTWTVTPTLLEAEVREVREIHHHRPRYNRRSTHPERAVSIGLTREPFPRLVVTRRPGSGHLDTIGPLPSRAQAERLVGVLQDAVAIRPCTPRLRVAQDHAACMLKDLGRCGAPCDGTQSREGYAEVVAHLRRLVDDPAGLLQALRARMVAFAADARFERAGELRERLHHAAGTLLDLRRRDAVGAVDRLVARRRTASGTEVALVTRGRLAATLRLPVGADDDAIRAALPRRGTDELPPAGPQDIEELALVLAWLEQPDVRVVDVEGTWAEPVAGGAALRAAVEERRQVARRVRHDRQVLSVTKVVRRTSAELEPPAPRVG